MKIIPSWIQRRAAVAALLAAAAVVAGLGWVASRAIGRWREDAEVGRARREVAAGRYTDARDRLARLAASRPGRDEVDYLLGHCESSLGRVGPALEAWGRVPADSPISARTALARGRLALEHGHLAAAEASLSGLADAPGPLGEEARRLVDQVDLYLGRSRPIARRIERRWDTASDPAAQLRLHWLLESQPMPVDPVAAALDRFAAEAPDDDRVWLARADLAARTGRLADADAWLARCEARRPDDPEVLRARLAWAIEAGRPELATEVASRLPARGFDPDEVASIASRLADLRGDAGAEKEALERLVDLRPGAPAWGRLAELAIRSGRAEESAHYRRRKAEIDRERDAYRTLVNASETGGAADLVALARAAERLGRRFEARGWWSLRLREAPGDAEAVAALDRIKPPALPPAPAGPLAGLIGPQPAPAGPRFAPDATPTGVPAFADVAESSGLRFTYDQDPTPLRRLPETMGGGLALLDYDGDGRLDVYCVQGGPFPGGSPCPPGGDRLFRNRGDGTFEDATEKSAIAGFPRGFGHGVAVGDYDNDGHPDLLVTRWRSYALYRNRGDGSFEDATGRSGLGGPRGWPTSAAFADLDGDGDLDLYVCQYLVWDPATSPPCPDPTRPDRHSYCVPKAFPAEPDRVYRNDGGTFVDVTKEAGILDEDGRGLGVVIADFDGDGRADIFVANDMSANFLFRNLGGFRFEEVAAASGCAANADGGYQAGMGIACGDVDGDGRPDLCVTNFYGESTTFYQNLGGGLFADRTVAANLSAPSRHVLGFGASFLDADDDGRLDLVQANGHVNDFRPGTPYAMPAQLFLGGGGGRFIDVSAHAGGCWSVPRVGRGLAVGDLDNDGREDVVIASQGSALACFRNLGSPAQGRSLTLQLEGRESNRDGVGAVVRVQSGGRVRTAWRFGGGSFLSACDGRLHLGLGPDSAPVAVEVRWPSGRVERHEGLEPGAAYRVVEGLPRLERSPGRPGPMDR